MSLEKIIYSLIVDKTKQLKAVLDKKNKVIGNQQDAQENKENPADY